MGTAKPDVIFVLSVDTEEEWDWSTPFPQVQPEVNNAQAIPAFQSFCDELGIRPTYFIDYAMADNEASAEVLRQVKAAHDCEFGAHLHPWCNPPLIERNGDFESHVVNLPIALVEQKLDALLKKLRETFETPIESFRTGRWGINAEVLNLLMEKGIKVDSSVYPFYKNEYFSCEGAPTTPYWPSLANPLQTSSQRVIAELPVSAGFNNRHFNFSNGAYQVINHKRLQFMRLTGIAWQTGLLRKIYLSPELTTAGDMNMLIDALLKRQSRLIHMNLHSSSLLNLDYSNNPFNSEQIYSNMRRTLSYLEANANVTFCTISDAAKRILN